MLKQELADQVLKEMGYKPASRCCKMCRHYVPTDCSGNIGAESEHCELNPAFHLPVEAAGYCNHFEEKARA